MSCALESPIAKVEQPILRQKKKTNLTGSNHTNLKPIASLRYTIEGCGMDGVADDSGNVIRQCSYLVEKPSSTIKDI